MPFKDPEARKAYAREWYLRNQERIKAKQYPRMKKLREDPEYRAEYNAYNLAYRHKNQDTHNANGRDAYRRRMAKPGYRADYNAKRLEYDRALREIGQDTVRELRSQDCFYCGKPGGGIDHIVPRSSGGGNEITNLLPACKPCNSSKGNKSLVDWYADKCLTF